MDISVYSFTAVAFMLVMMNDNGSALTLTYYGAERVMPHYNVMGVAKAYTADLRSVSCSRSGGAIYSRPAYPLAQ